MFTFVVVIGVITVCVFLYCGQENKYLTKLNLQYNEIGDEGARAIGAGLAVIVFMYFLVLLTFVVVSGVRVIRVSGVTMCLCFCFETEKQLRQNSLSWWQRYWS